MSHTASTKISKLTKVGAARKTVKRRSFQPKTNKRTPSRKFQTTKATHATHGSRKRKVKLAYSKKARAHRQPTQAKAPAHARHIRLAYTPKKHRRHRH